MTKPLTAPVLLTPEIGALGRVPTLEITKGCVGPALISKITESPAATDIAGSFPETAPFRSVPEIV